MARRLRSYGTHLPPKMGLARRRGDEVKGEGDWEIGRSVGEASKPRSSRERPTQITAHVRDMGRLGCG